MYTKNLKTISFHFGRKGSTNQRDAFKELDLNELSSHLFLLKFQKHKVY